MKVLKQGNLVPLFVMILKVLTFNLCNTQLTQKIKILQQFLNFHQVHVACFQEVSEQGLKLNNYNLYSSFIYRQNRHTAIAVRGDLIFRDVCLHPSGKMITGKINDLAIIFAHLPSGNNLKTEIFF